MSEISNQIVQIVGQAPEGFEWITYLTSCIILVLIVLMFTRLLMSLFNIRL